MIWLLAASFVHILISSLIGSLITVVVIIIGIAKNNSSGGNNSRSSRDRDNSVNYKNKDSINDSDIDITDDDNNAHSVFDTIICLISIGIPPFLLLPLLHLTFTHLSSLWIIIIILCVLCLSQLHQC